MPINAQPDDSHYLELIPGLWCPSRFIVHADDPERPHIVYAVVEPDIESGLLLANQLDIRRRDGGEPVTTASLRGVIVGPLIQACVPFLSTRTVDPDTGNVLTVSDAWINAEDVKHAKEHGTDQRTLQRVAHVYRLSLLREGKPTKAVASAFELTAPTASRWVAKARDAGFLGPVLGWGRPGEGASHG